MSEPDHPGRAATKQWLGMNWISLHDEHDLKELLRQSHEQPCIIFKNSNRCNISQMALHRLERNWANLNNEIKPYMVDVLSSRPLSNQIAATFKVRHESPQVLLIKNGECSYHSSHSAISVEDLQDQLQPS